MGSWRGAWCPRWDPAKARGGGRPAFRMVVSHAAGRLEPARGKSPVATAPLGVARPARVARGSSREADPRSLVPGLRARHLQSSLQSRTCCHPSHAHPIMANAHPHGRPGLSQWPAARPMSSRAAQSPTHVQVNGPPQGSGNSFGGMMGNWEEGWANGSAKVRLIDEI